MTKPSTCVLAIILEIVGSCFWHFLWTISLNVLLMLLLHPLEEGCSGVRVETRVCPWCIAECLIQPEYHAVVISQGTTVGANNRSWTAPTYIMGGNIAEIPGDEDPIPADGNPHPAHGQPLAGNPNNFQNWLHDHAGAGAQVLADAGINDQLMQDINEEIVVEMNQNLAHNAMQANDEEEMQQGLMAEWVPQHPDQPQDTITFDQSGSTANYLRATGPDVHLSVEEVLVAVAAMQGDQNSNNSSSDDSGTATLERMLNVVILDFIIRACQRLPRTDVLPLLMPVKKVVEWKEDLSKAIVPLHPVVDCLIIKVWAISQKESDIQSIQAPGDPIAIPRIVSKRPGARTPLVDTMVHRSPRINPSAVDG